MRKLFVALVAGVLAFVLMPNLVAQADGDDDKCYETVVVKAAWTEVIEHPAVTHEETTTVIDAPAWDEKVIDRQAVPGQHYSLKGNSGIETDEVPVFPADYWQANTVQEPHDNGANDPAQKPDGSVYTDGDSGLHYTSAGSSGKRDWFYYRAPVAEVSHIVHHSAVTHEETKVVVDKAAWTETVQHPAVTDHVEVPCDTEEPPVVPPVDEEPPVTGPETPVKGNDGAKPKPHADSAPAPAPVDEPVAIPTAVDAGL